MFRIPNFDTTLGLVASDYKTRISQTPPITAYEKDNWLTLVHPRREGFACPLDRAATPGRVGRRGKLD